MTQEINEATSKRICSHMNQDHASTAHGILMRCVPHSAANVKLSGAKLKSVSLQGMTVSYVQCTGEMCEMKTSFVPFDPPLTTSDQVRPRMIEIHNQVCAPQVSWLVTNPAVAVLLTICALIAYAVVVVGVDNLAKSIDASPFFQPIVSAVFGSSTMFGKLLTWSLYFTVVAHGAEALWVAYECKKTLKLQLRPTLLWFFLVCLTGYPVTTEFITLRKIHVEAKEAKKQS